MIREISQKIIFSKFQKISQKLNNREDLPKKSGN
jgi:hypothetical protein